MMARRETLRQRTRRQRRRERAARRRAAIRAAAGWLAGLACMVTLAACIVAAMHL
jgi:hypothetical protein